MPNHYEVLEISESATEDEIRKAYRRAARRYHPDRPGGDREKFARVNEAYAVLKDPSSRTQYNAHLRFMRQFGGSAGGSANYAGTYPGASTRSGSSYPWGGMNDSGAAGGKNGSGTNSYQNYVFVSPEDFLRTFFFAGNTPNSFTEFFRPSSQAEEQIRQAKRAKTAATFARLRLFLLAAPTFLFGLLFGGGQTVFLVLAAPILWHYYRSNRAETWWQKLCPNIWYVFQVILGFWIITSNFSVIRALILGLIYFSFAYWTWVSAQAGHKAALLFDKLRI